MNRRKKLKQTTKLITYTLSNGDNITVTNRNITPLLNAITNAVKN